MNSSGCPLAGPAPVLTSRSTHLEAHVPIPFVSWHGRAQADSVSTLASLAEQRRQRLTRRGRPGWASEDAKWEKIKIKLGERMQLVQEYF